MFQTIIRTALIYFFIFLAVKIMGKRELAELHPFDLVVLLIISDMASIAMQGQGTPLLNSIIPIIVLTILEIGISQAELNHPKLRRFISGNPSILIKDGKINQKELQKLRMNLDDLTEELREQGYFQISDVDYAVMENDGKVNVLPKSKFKPLTQEDIGLNLPQEKASFILIENGEIDEAELKRAGKNKHWLNKEIKKQGKGSINNIFLAELTQDGLHLEAKETKP